MKLSAAIAIAITVLGLGCGKGDGKGGKTVGPEVCPVIAAKAKVCHDAFWGLVSQDATYGADYKKDYEGKEQAWCEQQMQIHEAQPDVLDSCVKIDDCKAWSACVYPNGLFHGNKK